MALHNEINNLVLDDCISSIPAKYFTTFQVVSELEKKYPEIVSRIQAFSNRNWRAIIGKAIKRYSLETNNIRQISGPSESPARWEKKM